MGEKCKQLLLFATFGGNSRKFTTSSIGKKCRLAFNIGFPTFEAPPSSGSIDPEIETPQFFLSKKTFLSNPGPTALRLAQEALIQAGILFNQRRAPSPFFRTKDREDGSSSICIGGNSNSDGVKKRRGRTD